MPLLMVPKSALEITDKIDYKIAAPLKFTPQIIDFFGTTSLASSLAEEIERSNPDLEA